MQSSTAGGDAEPRAVPEEGEAGGEHGPPAAEPAGTAEEVQEVPSDGDQDGAEGATDEGFPAQGGAAPSAFQQQQPGSTGARPAAVPDQSPPEGRDGAERRDPGPKKQDEEEKESYSSVGEEEEDDFEEDEAPPALVPSQGPRPAGTPGSTLFAAGIDEREADRRQRLHEEQDRLERDQRGDGSDSMGSSQRRRRQDAEAQRRRERELELRRVREEAAAKEAARKQEIVKQILEERRMREAEEAQRRREAHAEQVRRHMKSQKEHARRRQSELRALAEQFRDTVALEEQRRERAGASLRAWRAEAAPAAQRIVHHLAEARAGGSRASVPPKALADIQLPASLLLQACWLGDAEAANGMLHAALMSDVAELGGGPAAAEGGAADAGAPQGDTAGQSDLVSWFELDSFRDGSLSRLVNATEGPVMGVRALHVACENGYRRLAQVLIWYGADMQATTLADETPLHMCVALWGLSLLASLTLLPLRVCRGGHAGIARDIVCAAVRAGTAACSRPLPTSASPYFQSVMEQQSSAALHGALGASRARQATTAPSRYPPATALEDAGTLTQRPDHAVLNATPAAARLALRLLDRSDGRGRAPAAVAKQDWLASSLRSLQRMLEERAGGGAASPARLPSVRPLLSSPKTPVSPGQGGGIGPRRRPRTKSATLSPLVTGAPHSRTRRAGRDLPPPAVPARGAEPGGRRLHSSARDSRGPAAAAGQKRPPTALETVQAPTAHSPLSRQPSTMSWALGVAEAADTTPPAQGAMRRQRQRRWRGGEGKGEGENDDDDEGWEGEDGPPSPTTSRDRDTAAEGHYASEQGSGSEAEQQGPQHGHTSGTPYSPAFSAQSAGSDASVKLAASVVSEQRQQGHRLVLLRSRAAGWATPSPSGTSLRVPASHLGTAVHNDAQRRAWAAQLLRGLSGTKAGAERARAELQSASEQLESVGATSSQRASTRGSIGHIEPSPIRRPYTTGQRVLREDGGDGRRRDLMRRDAHSVSPDSASEQNGSHALPSLALHRLPSRGGTGRRRGPEPLGARLEASRDTAESAAGEHKGRRRVPSGSVVLQPGTRTTGQARKGTRGGGASRRGSRRSRPRSRRVRDQEGTGRTVGQYSEDLGPMLSKGQRAHIAEALRPHSEAMQAGSSLFVPSESALATSPFSPRPVEPAISLRRRLGGPSTLVLPPVPLPHSVTQAYASRKQQSPSPQSRAQVSLMDSIGRPSGGDGDGSGEAEAEGGQSATDLAASAAPPPLVHSADGARFAPAWQPYPISATVRHATRGMARRAYFKAVGLEDLMPSQPGEKTHRSKSKRRAR